MIQNKVIESYHNKSSKNHLQFQHLSLFEFITNFTRIYKILVFKNCTLCNIIKTKALIQPQVQERFVNVLQRLYITYKEMLQPDDLTL